MKRLLIGIAAVTSLFATSAFAADLPARTYAKAPAYIDPGYNWSGFYIGGNVGYSWGSSSNSEAISRLNTGLVLFTNNSRNDVNGVIGGGQIGYNWQAGSFIYGLEADIQATNIQGKVTILGLGIGSKLDYLGTVRGRFGYAFVPNAFIYATGGLAYGSVKTNVANIISFGGTNTGWTAGAGIEYALTQNWSLKTEYMYVDLGKKNSLIVPGLSVGVKNTEHIVRAGLNYRFNWGAPSAVVAKY
jgi:outer membrane immunogenic protein